MLRSKLLIGLALAGASALWAQEFEVASVHMVEQAQQREVCGPTVKRGRQGGPGAENPERVTYNCRLLIQLVAEAYGLEKTLWQLSGNEKVGSATVNFAATLKPGATDAEYRQMLRKFLTDRFHLKAHLERRNNDVYEITVEKSGLKMKENRENPPDGVVPPAPGRQGADGMPELPRVPGRVLAVVTQGKAREVGVNVPVSELLGIVQATLRAPVTDRTGLSGKYDFQLDFDPGASFERPGAVATDTFVPMPVALKEQLGLHLERKKGQVEFLVIDSIDSKPTEN